MCLQRQHDCAFHRITAFKGRAERAHGRRLEQKRQRATALQFLLDRAHELYGQ